MDEIHICYIGDSYVAGMGDSENLGWVGRLRTTAQGYNLGVGGETSRGVLRRWQREVELRFPKNSDNRIVFSFGVNDSMMFGYRVGLSETESVENLKSILSEALKQYRVLMIGPPPIESDEYNEHIESLDKKYAKICKDLGVPYFSLYSHLEDDPVWYRELASIDGVHPRAEGYALIAKHINDWDQWWF
jgi:lysophospholipase L1-like esterase